jgi:uncharacterized membrane protein
MKKVQLILLIAASTFIFSCSKSSDVPATNPIVTVTYQKDIKNIMSTNCTGCHSNAGSKTLPYLDTYDLVKTNIAKVSTRINIATGQQGIMPPSQRLPQATIDLVKAWVTQGSVN